MLPGPPPPATVHTSTPADLEETQHLLSGVSASTAAELDLLEGQALIGAYRNLASRLGSVDLLAPGQLLGFHREAFGSLYSWGGRYRSVELNIGISASAVPEAVGQLMGSVDFWHQEGVFSDEEAAVRFSAELRRIHPFRNGNSRTARLYAQLLIYGWGSRTYLNWSAVSIVDWRQRRDEYLAALDEVYRQDDASRLLRFALAD